MGVYCMECGKLNCEKVNYVAKNGFVFVDNAGLKTSNGTQTHTGYHAAPKAKEANA